jgi:Fanconi-associated nuclease 1
MILHAQSTASHNQMLGQRIRHPPSTKFDDDFESPAAKRLKRLDSTDSSYSRTESEEERPEPKTKASSKEIRDSEAETEDENDSLPLLKRQTDLEVALPPVETDKEAIAEYEAFKAAQEAIPLDVEGRLGQRKWIKGKSSIYVDAFNLALETVLEDEGHLFDEAEMGVFQQWRGMSYEAQYL